MDISANVVDLSSLRCQQKQRAREAEQRCLEEAAVLVVAAADLVGVATTSRLTAALTKRLG